MEIQHIISLALPKIVQKMHGWIRTNPYTFLFQTTAFLTSWLSYQVFHHFRTYHSASCLSLETSHLWAYEVVAFFSNDDSIFTRQIQDLRLAAKSSTEIKMSVKSRKVKTKMLTKVKKEDQKKYSENSLNKKMKQS